MDAPIQKGWKEEPIPKKKKGERLHDITWLETVVMATAKKKKTS